MDSVSGSPPRRRGKEVADEGIGGIIRITPAWAGKSQGHRADRGAEQDHPRMGGEKTMYFEDKYFCRGSPPRRRGKEGAQLAEKTGIRITPAWAGKSLVCARGLTRAQDHPRVGGEKFFHEPEELPGGGSSPRWRGKVRPHSYRASTVGITPALAGKSGCTWTISSAWRDHPRIGGEKSASMAA